jgi:hypothetical protein
MFCRGNDAVFVFSSREFVNSKNARLATVEKTPAAAQNSNEANRTRKQKSQT